MAEMSSAEKLRRGVEFTPFLGYTAFRNIPTISLRGEELGIFRVSVHYTG